MFRRNWIILLWTLMLCFMFRVDIVLAQGPQIPLTGSIGVQGNVSVLGGVTINLPTDSNLTLTSAQWANKTLIVTSSVSLSATRNIVAPLNQGQEYNIANKTTGGQSIQIIGATGTGVTIANGSSATVFTDGVNYLRGSAVATAFDHTPNPCTGGQLAGGIDAQGNSINCAAASGGLPSTINGLVQGNGASAATQATPTQVINALGTSNGLSVFGDSIGGSTGTTSTGLGNVPFMNGYAELLQNSIGGPFLLMANSGDQVADNSIKFAFKGAYPQGGGLDPIYVNELGTNDAIFYLGDANKQLNFQAFYQANLVNLGVSASLKKFAQTCTLAGGFAADPVNSPYPGMGILATTSGATASCPFTAPKASNNTAYACYEMRDSPNGGTFTISIDGTPQTDPLSGSTTWTTGGYGGALIHTNNNQNSAFSCARFTGLSSGSHTFLFTVTSATSASNAVYIEYVAYAPAVDPTNNPLVIAVSPNQQNTGSAGAPFVATYAGYVQTIVTNLAGDGLNLKYADTSNALLNDPSCGNGNAATMFALCYLDTVHPDNLGHAVMASTILAQIPTAKKNGATFYNPSQPLQNRYPGQFYATASTPGNPLGPYGFFNINPYNLIGNATTWGQGLLLSLFNGQAEYIAHTANGGLTIGTPASASICKSGSGGIVKMTPPSGTDCDLVYSTNGLFNFFQGSTAASGLSIQGNQMTGGNTFSIVIPGTIKMTGNTSGWYSTTAATNQNTNTASKTGCYYAGTWNNVTGVPGFDGPCWQGVPVNPTPAGAVPQVYMTLLNGAAASAALDLRNAILANEYGTGNFHQLTGDSTSSLSVKTLSVNGTNFSILRGTTPAIGGSALTAGQCSSTSPISVSPVLGTSTVISVSPNGGTPGDAYIWKGYAASSSTIVVQVCAIVAGTPTSTTYAYEINP